MTERVTTWRVGVEWEPGAPEAILISDDFGRTVLALNAHDDDSDQRCVVFRWTATSFVSMGGPNDEAISGHRLYQRGLKDVSWAGIVKNSELIAGLEQQNRVHHQHDPSRFEKLTHYVLPLKENIVEVAAESVQIRRIPGPTTTAAMTALGS